MTIWGQWQCLSWCNIDTVHRKTRYQNVTAFARHLSYTVPYNHIWHYSREDMYISEVVHLALWTAHCAFGWRHLKSCWVSLKICESLLPSMNGIMAFICLPQDRNMVRSFVGWPFNMSASGSEDHVCKMFSHHVHNQEFTIKWYRLTEALPVSCFYYPIPMVEFFQMEYCNVSNWIMVTPMKIRGDGPFEVYT